MRYEVSYLCITVVVGVTFFLLELLFSGGRTASAAGEDEDDGAKA